MATAHTFLEAQTFKHLTQVVKTDGGIGSSAQHSPEDFVRSHKDILPAAYAFDLASFAATKRISP